MPMRRADYPADWERISAAIRERAAQRCEGTPRHPHCRAENGRPHPATGSRVVLTVAHWPDSDKMNCRPENLRALCQRCHLDLDFEHHMRNRRNTLAQRLAAGQRDLFAEERGMAEEAWVLHCWADRQEWSEAAGGWLSFTCLLPDGHAGEHEWVPDGQVVIEFLPAEKEEPS